jgi:hypothetical protein
VLLHERQVRIALIGGLTRLENDLPNLLGSVIDERRAVVRRDLVQTGDERPAEDEVEVVVERRVVDVDRVLACRKTGVLRVQERAVRVEQRDVRLVVDLGSQHRERWRA